MAARHYGQFLDASDPDQSADDDWRLALAPAEIVRGAFRLGYIPRDDSSYASTRCLLSVLTSAGHLSFAIEPTEGGEAMLAVRNGESQHALVGPITFSAGQELIFTFSAFDGVVSVSGATTGDQTLDAFAWNISRNAMRIGGSVLGGEVARGYVSLPYAIPGSVLGEEGTLLGSELDFSHPNNSALIALL